MAGRILRPLSSTSTQTDLVRELIDQIKADGLTEGDRLPSIRALAEQHAVTASAVRALALSV